MAPFTITRDGAGWIVSDGARKFVFVDHASAVQGARDLVKAPAPVSLVDLFGAASR